MPIIAINKSGYPFADSSLKNEDGGVFFDSDWIKPVGDFSSRSRQFW